MEEYNDTEEINVDVDDDGMVIYISLRITKKTKTLKCWME